MRKGFVVLGPFVLATVVACSSDAPRARVEPALPGPAAPSRALFTFAGSFDGASRTLSVVATAAPNAGGARAASTLPYGSGPGEVYFHTCSLAYDTTAHRLTGNVQAVNKMTGDVGAFNAVIDSITPSSLTLGSGPGAGQPSGTIASYGTVSPNTGDCASTMAWTFDDPADVSFTFRGHADGTTSGSSTSCAAIHAASPGAPSGSYTITPSAGSPYTAYCDMTTDGGGWTLVFVPPSPLMDSSTIGYTSGDPALLASATTMLMALRDQTLAVLPHRATFPMPTNWRQQTPFEYDFVDEPVNVSIDGAAPVATTLRYGNTNWPNVCTDGWDGVASDKYGRVCIENTLAPFYTGFDFGSHVGADGHNFCNDSSQSYNATLCTTSLQFTLAVR